MLSQLQDFLNTEPLNIRNTERRSCVFAARFLSPKKAMNHRKHPRNRSWDLWLVVTDVGLLTHCVTPLTAKGFFHEPFFIFCFLFFVTDFKKKSQVEKKFSTLC